MTQPKKNPRVNAEKQKRFRERQKAAGKKQVRGYVSPEALSCYEEIQQKMWFDIFINTTSDHVKVYYSAYWLLISTDERKFRW